VFYSKSEFYVEPVPFYWLHAFQVYGTYVIIALFVFAMDLIIRLNSRNIALNPLLSSLLASALSVFVVRVSRPLRKVSMMTNLIVLAATLTLSLMLASGTSDVPEKSWKTMCFFWGAYAVYLFFLGGDRSAKKPEKLRR
jgi:hypothetical protein